MLCKYCGNPISASTKVCPMCGIALAAPAEEGRTAAESRNKVMKRLPFAVSTFLLFVCIIFSISCHQP